MHAEDRQCEACWFKALHFNSNFRDGELVVRLTEPGGSSSFTGAKGRGKELEEAEMVERSWECRGPPRPRPLRRDTPAPGRCRDPAARPSWA